MITNLTVWQYTGALLQPSEKCPAEYSVIGPVLYTVHLYNDGVVTRSTDLCIIGDNFPVSL